MSFSGGGDWYKIVLYSKSYFILQILRILGGGGNEDCATSAVTSSPITLKPQVDKEGKKDFSGFYNKYTNTQIHRAPVDKERKKDFSGFNNKYTNTQIHKYTNTLSG